VWHDSLTCMMRAFLMYVSLNDTFNHSCVHLEWVHLHTCMLTHLIIHSCVSRSSVCHDSVIFKVEATSHRWMRHGESDVTVRTQDVTLCHMCVCEDSRCNPHICVVRLIHLCDMTQSLCDMTHSLCASRSQFKTTSGNPRSNLKPQTATHCNTLQHTATHCNTLQHTNLKPQTSNLKAVYLKPVE